MGTSVQISTTHDQLNLEIGKGVNLCEHKKERVEDN